MSQRAARIIWASMAEFRTHPDATRADAYLFDIRLPDGSGIDLLRCINAHEDSWLVASFREVTNRRVMEGTFGCPLCSAEYQIKNGVGDFTGGEPITDGEQERSSVMHRREELATRAGAYLDATQPGTTIVLGGLWAYAAHELSEMADVRVIAVNAPTIATTSIIVCEC